MTLVDFYNLVFLPEVQEMMASSEIPKFLYTPIRESQLRKVKEGKLSLPPISKISSGNGRFDSAGPTVRLGLGTPGH